jgi:hypothetical protein
MRDGVHIGGHVTIRQTLDVLMQLLKNLFLLVLPTVGIGLAVILSSRHFVVGAIERALFSSSPLFASDACSYLTNEEVERITGRELLFKLTSMPLFRYRTLATTLMPCT